MGRKKIKREGKCCDAFRAWCKSEEGRAYITEIMNEMGYDPHWIMHQMKEAYLWQADPDQEDRWRFSTFFRNWLRKGKKIEIDENQRAKLMSAEREQQYYKDKRRGGHSNEGFSKAGDV